MQRFDSHFTRKALYAHQIEATIIMIRSLLFLLVLLQYSCTPRPNGELSKGGSTQIPDSYETVVPVFEKPKNIILMIGDGMGLTQITAGLYSNNNYLNLERFSIIGLHKSYSSDNLVTDSAAAATSFATGKKTYNGAIGVDPDTTALYTILEEAEDKGLATGMVTTSTIVHATPASFIAHEPLRSYYEAIAADFMTVDIDLFIGGGKKYFDRREDDRNLVEELKQKGYYVSSYFDKDLDELPIDYSKNLAYFTADSDPLTVEQGRSYLKQASMLACDFLSNKAKDKGFFLMIEGAQIDWGGHANNSEYIINEMIDFDNTIGAVLDFAQADGNTLVIITADHETGGYAINLGSTQDTIFGAFTSDYHTATLIPVFADGPGAELFRGIYENTAIYDKMRMAYGFGKENN
jgi:alkaline phosphatase